MSYVDEAFYAALIRDLAGWEDEIVDPATREQCRVLLEREARLLDQGRFEEWLAMYSPQCIYWIPATPGGDPRREVAVAFDDRRRLEDRVYRLRTGHAWSQWPASRTVRLVANVEAFRLAGDALLVRSNFIVSEFRAGETRFWSGWCAQRVRGSLIEVRQVNLVDCDQPLRNPSLIL